MSQKPVSIKPSLFITKNHAVSLLITHADGYRLNKTLTGVARQGLSQNVKGYILERLLHEKSRYFVLGFDAIQSHMTLKKLDIAF